MESDGGRVECSGFNKNVAWALGLRRKYELSLVGHVSRADAAAFKMSSHSRLSSGLSLMEQNSRACITLSVSNLPSFSQNLQTDILSFFPAILSSCCLVGYSSIRNKVLILAALMSFTVTGVFMYCLPLLLKFCFLLQWRNDVVDISSSLSIIVLW